MTRRKVLSIIFIFVALTALIKAERLDIEVYVYDPCGGCSAPGVGCRDCSIISEIANRYREIFSEEKPSIKFYNLRMRGEYFEELRARLSSENIDVEQLALPIMYIGDRAFTADGSMDDAIKRFVKDGYLEHEEAKAYLKEKSNSSEKSLLGTVVYLYSQYCEDCIDVARWLKFGGLTSGYEVVAVDIMTAEGQEIEKLILENLNVPVDEYIVPFISYGSFWFAGKTSIYLSLNSRIKEYPNLYTRVFADEN